MGPASSETLFERGKIMTKRIKASTPRKNSNSSPAQGAQAATQTPAPSPLDALILYFRKRKRGRGSAKVGKVRRPTPTTPVKRR
jgi:hypothetical protein